MSTMSEHVLTELSATVDPAREDELLAGFQNLLQAPFPDGLLRSELLRGGGDTWRIQTLWRDRATLDTMFAGTEPHAGSDLFRSVGAEPLLQILEVAADRKSVSES